MADLDKRLKPVLVFLRFIRNNTQLFPQVARQNLAKRRKNDNTE